MLERSFDRVPFAFEHKLSALELFDETSLHRLAQRYTDRDAFVADGAPSADTPFYDVEHDTQRPSEALRLLDHQRRRILLKRPEGYDPAFRRLLSEIFAELLRMHAPLRAERVVRLESSVLISSGDTITPFHFDPEISFFFQIAGEKRYHVYAPRAVHENELERFYVKGVVDIGQLELGERDSSCEYVFALAGGRGMHQPQNAPHWVETSGGRSVSYVVSFETAQGRMRGRTRSFNHYLRRLGTEPAALGEHPSLDAAKAATMRVAIPMRRMVGRTLRRGRAR
ncbi:MAG: hypothetical protein JO060_09665 [Candidatus Eremiobacteraeota bacterium]|nr:hypothetical protein [Candidatus Eremiobacteraeota bacterium]